jgi:hypothetical protein
MTDQAQLLPGTLDLLTLKAVSLGPLHGYGVLLRIGQISGRALLIEPAAGRKRLCEETEGCNCLAAAIGSALATQPGEI